MPDLLIRRLDKFVMSLLEEAEGGCSQPSESVTKDASEDIPGSEAESLVTFDQRTALLKACTAYLNVRAGKAAGEEEPEDPEIVGIVERLRPNYRKARR
jgi:hypothetical protein